jgi:hypothetical protein
MRGTPRFVSTAAKEIAVYPWSDHEIPQVHGERELGEFTAAPG